MIPHLRFPALRLCCILTLSLPGFGCATLIGSSRPVEEKAEGYEIQDLSRLSADWVKDSELTAGETTRPASPTHPENFAGGDGETGAESALADQSWRSTRTGAIITLNSVCRPSHAAMTPSADTLRKLSQPLFLGIENIQFSEEKDLQLGGALALEKTVIGSLQSPGEKPKRVKIRTITVLRGECLFDLMLVAAPSRFAVDEEIFRRFTESLRSASR